MPMGAPTAIGEAVEADLLVAVVDLVARLSGDAELLTEAGHLLAIE
jgi:hypothetical protein